MKIVAFFTSSGVPATGLSPTIRIRNVSTGALVVTDASMTETGDGFYNYNFTAYDSTVDYAIRCDGTASLPDAERYTYAGNESYFDDIQDATWSAQLSGYAGKGTAGATQQCQLYGEHVVIDVAGGEAGTSWPIGTHRYPVNNITDGIAITTARKLDRFFLHGPLTVEATDNINGYSFQGHDGWGPAMTFTAGCSANETSYSYMSLDGEVTSGNVLLIESCTVGELLNFSGVMNLVNFSQGAEISIATWANIIEGNAGGEPTNEPEISLNSASVTITKYTGNLKLTNKTGANRTTVELAGGNLIIDATCVAGTIQLLGHGFIEADNSGAGCTVDTEGFLSLNTISESSSDAVWDELVADHTTAGTYGHELATKADIAASTSTTFTTATTGAVIQGTEAAGTWASTELRDDNEWQITESVANGITVELTFNIPEDDRPGVFQLFGRYEGQPSSTHYQELWTWNYEASAWENLVEIFLPGGNTVDAEYEHEYFERNVDRTNNNEVKFRIVHHVTTYVGSHNMFIDSAVITSIAVITAEDIADAVWSKTLSGGYTAEQYMYLNNEYLKRLLGLTHENIYIDNPSYDVNSNLVSARVRIYSDSASVGTSNNIIGTYQISSDTTGQGPGKFNNWRQVKV